MSKAFIAAAIQDSIECTGVAAQQAAADVIQAIKDSLEDEGYFTLPGFGTFRICETKARTALNPRTQEKVEVPPGFTVRFKAAPVMKQRIKEHMSPAKKTAKKKAGSAKNGSSSAKKHDSAPKTEAAPKRSAASATAKKVATKTTAAKSAKKAPATRTTRRTKK